MRQLLTKEHPLKGWLREVVAPGPFLLENPGLPARKTEWSQSLSGSNQFGSTTGVRKQALPPPVVEGRRLLRNVAEVWRSSLESPSVILCRES